MNVEKIVLTLLSLALILSGVGLVIMNKDISTLEEITQAQQQDLEYFNEQIEALQPTQMQRYFYSLIDEVVLNGEVQFIEIGEAYSSEIEGYDYQNYVIELEALTMVEITIEFETNWLTPYDELVDLNIYYNGITEPDMVYEYLTKTETITLALQEGFNTIELDSYSSRDWEYTLVINYVD